jgi:hypothetical protein
MTSPNSTDKLFLNSPSLLLSITVSENEFILNNVDHNIHITSIIIITEAILSLLSNMLPLFIDNITIIDIKNTIKKIAPKEEKTDELF